ncbi:unnamed protein product [Sphagnum tenellum]
MHRLDPLEQPNLNCNLKPSQSFQFRGLGLGKLVGEIISRFECKGFVLTGLKLFQTPEKLAQTHDFELKEKQFYPKLVEYIISSPVICMVCVFFFVAFPIVMLENGLKLGSELHISKAVIVPAFIVQVSFQVSSNFQALWIKDSKLVDWAQQIIPWLHE